MGKVKRWFPHTYQKYCVYECIKNKFMALLLAPGMGKSSIILQVYKKLKRVGKVKGVLIVAPLRPAFMTWPSEVKKWRNFKNISYTILHDQWGNKDLNITRKKDLYIINPEGLPWLISKLKGKRRGDWPFDMLVVDESTKFKETSTKRFYYMKKLVPLFKRRYILTGTPTPNGMQNLQGQLYIVDKGETFGTTKSYFMNDYFKPVGNPKWKQFEVRKDKLKKIYRKFAKYAIRLRAEDHLDMPEIMFNYIDVQLPPKARKIYDTMEKDFFAEIEGQGLTALSAGSAYQKCWQMANGAVYKQDLDIIQPSAKKKRPTEFNIIHDAKLEALDNLIDELGGKPLLIAYRFKHDYKRLKKHFGKRLENIGEGATMLDCIKIQNKWNKGKIELLAAYPGTSALGLNLQEAGNDVCYFSLIEDLEAWEQFYRRIYRQGMKGVLMRVHHLVAKNTVDELILARTAKKDKNQKKFLNFVYEYKRKRLQSFKNDV